MGHITLETPWALFFVFSALGSTLGKIVGMRQIKRPTTTMTPQDNFSRVGFFRTISNLEEKKKSTAVLMSNRARGGGVEGEGGEGEGVEGGRRWHSTLAEHKDGTASLICSWGRSGKILLWHKKNSETWTQAINNWWVFPKGRMILQQPHNSYLLFWREKEGRGHILILRNLFLKSKIPCSNWLPGDSSNKSFALNFCGNKSLR